ncbi:MAG: 16S rRNA processing protein RimM [Coriobacteriia bacterium]|nr:16S rRNA processing protein RimM [Coriobacteriia bacterium]MBN2840976.1 16S rRNA processing protein RimM [Coriobacteriia bacterium]
MTVPYRRAGRIQKSHGTQGEVVVAIGDGLSFSDLEGLELWVVPPPAVVRPHRVLDVRSGPKGAVVTLDGVDTAAAAHEIVGRWLLAASDAFPEDQGAASDVIGYAVTDARRGYLGVVTDIIVTGANDVLVVDEGPFGQVLLPVIDQVVRDVDDAAGSIAVVLLDGLIDEEAD